jgi:hypothetical protein
MLASVVVDMICSIIIEKKCPRERRPGIKTIDELRRIAAAPENGLEGRYLRSFLLNQHIWILNAMAMIGFLSVTPDVLGNTPVWSAMIWIVVIVSAILNLVELMKIRRIRLA